MEANRSGRTIEEVEFIRETQNKQMNENFVLD
jgi:hypothetical protein